MKFIAHRINTIKELKKVPTKYGIEIDLRDYENNLILQHDPFKVGESFENFIKYYNHNTIILNIKSEGIEFKVLEILKKNKINNYFFLDSSFPIINKFIEKKFNKFAIRVSEIEHIETAFICYPYAKWVWIDCLSKLNLNIDSYKELRKLNYKICLVGPDLLGRNEEINIYNKFFIENNFQVDAICTKIQNIQLWK